MQIYTFLINQHITYLVCVFLYFYIISSCHIPKTWLRENRVHVHNWPVCSPQQTQQPDAVSQFPRCLQNRNQDNRTPEVICVSLNANLLDKLFNTRAANLKSQLLTLRWDLRIILPSLMMLHHDSWAVSYSECFTVLQQKLIDAPMWQMLRVQGRTLFLWITTDNQVWATAVGVIPPRLCRRSGDSGCHCLGLSVWLMFVLMNI